MRAGTLTAACSITAIALPLVRAVQYIGVSKGTTECACFDMRNLQVFGGGHIDKW